MRKSVVTAVMTGLFVLAAACMASAAGNWSRGGEWLGDENDAQGVALARKIRGMRVYVVFLQAVRTVPSDESLSDYSGQSRRQHLFLDAEALKTLRDRVARVGVYGREDYVARVRQSYRAF